VTDNLQKNPKIDPTIFATAHKQNRFYLFTQREPESLEEEGDRDVINEKIFNDSAVKKKAKSRLGSSAIIHTTSGDIYVKLFATECPKTIENFCVHSQNGYYNNVIFHRVIKDFMIQTGDPTGDGTGGESIWGGEFEDEFNTKLTHDSFVLSMANAGPNTNGSQFFITVRATPSLNFKHTVFGKVTKGSDVALAISKVNTSKHDKPVDDIKILNIKVNFDE